MNKVATLLGLLVVVPGVLAQTETFDDKVRDAEIEMLQSVMLDVMQENALRESGQTSVVDLPSDLVSTEPVSIDIESVAIPETIEGFEVVQIHDRADVIDWPRSDSDGDAIVDASGLVAPTPEINWSRGCDAIYVEPAVVESATEVVAPDTDAIRDAMLSTLIARADYVVETPAPVEEEVVTAESNGPSSDHLRSAMLASFDRDVAVESLTGIAPDDSADQDRDQQQQPRPKKDEKKAAADQTPAEKKSSRQPRRARSNSDNKAKAEPRRRAAAKKTDSKDNEKTDEGAAKVNASGTAIHQERPDYDISGLELSGEELTVEVLPDGSVFIYGNESDVAQVQQLIQQLDQDTAARAYRIITLEKRDATEVAESAVNFIEQLYPQSADRDNEQFAINAVSTNIVVVVGPDSRIEQVVEYIKAIDLVPPSLPEFEEMSFEIKYRKPSVAAEQLKQVIGKLKESMGGEAESPDFQIIPWDDIGRITVIGPKSQEAKIRKLLDAIDVEPKAGFGEVKLAFFQLINNDASDMADTLEDLLKASEDSRDEDTLEAIRRLQMVIMKGPDGETRELPPVDLEKQIRLIPDDASQALIVATVEENLEPLGALIELLDRVPVAVEMGMRIFPLKYADAETVADLIEDMFDKGKDLPKPAPGSESTDAVPDGSIGKSLVYNIAVSADTRTNTLIVSGRPEQVALVQMVVSEVDTPENKIKFPLTLFKLEHSDATKMAKMLTDLFEQRIESLESRDAGNSAIERERVYITTDIRTNSLIVSASEENLAEIRDILTRLDTASADLFEGIRIINCNKTAATSIQTMIEDLWERKADLRGEADLPEDSPVVVTDQRSNSLIIASSPEDFEEIQRLVDRLESQPLAPIAEIRMITLKNNDANEVSDMLSDLFEERMEQRLARDQEENPADRVAIVTDTATNTMLIASSKENFDEISRIVHMIDVEPDLEGVIKIFHLNNAVSSLVAGKLEDLFSDGLYNPSVGLDSNLNEDRQKVSLIDDPRSNSIIVSASKVNLSIIEKLIKEMDIESPQLLEAVMELFPLEYADAVKTAQMLEDLFDGISSGVTDSDLFPEPTVIADERSNTLIVAGTRDAINRARDLLKTIDVEGNIGTAVFEIYPLKHASAAKLGMKITEIFDERENISDAEGAPIYILAEESTNSLVCMASKSDQGQIAHLISLLDKPSSIASQFEIFPLKWAKAEAMAESLESLFESNADGANIDRVDVQAIEPDERTNSLIVWASPSEMQSIAEIIDKLDVNGPVQSRMVKLIRLQNALAEDFADVLEETLTGQGSDNDKEAVVISFEQIGTDGRKYIRKLLRQDVTITPDPRSNSLLVMAPEESMGMLEALIESFDRIRPNQSEIRLYPLLNADAEEVQEKLEDIFEDGGSEEVNSEFYMRNNAASVVSYDEEFKGVRLPLKFSADTRTNTVIVAGHPVDLNMVGQLVEMLDISDVEERINEVVKLQYATAEDVQAAIKDFVDEERDRLDDIEDEQSAQRKAERHVTVIGDETTNSVLVGVSPRYYSQIMNLIHQIDQPPPQVMIQVLIAEVTLTDSVELGFEWAWQDLEFSKNAVQGPNGTVTGAGHDWVVGTDVGAAGSGLGGFSFTLTGEDFGFLFRALQTDGLIEVLSRPTIMVKNNEEANITIGDRVPYPTNNTVSDSGQVNTSVSYEKVGIILDVVPHINPDGYVNLEVKPEISSMNPSSVNIAQGLNAPTFTERSAETVVTVKDGETVVIGGLIKKERKDTSNQMPIAGDIPIIGQLFRATDNEETRTELLFVLTVDVIRDEDDARAISEEIRDDGPLTPEMKRSALMQGLRITPDEAAFGPRDGADRPDEDTFRARQKKGNRPLYGPSVQPYGPTEPEKSVEVQTSKAPVYGPVLASHED